VEERNTVKLKRTLAIFMAIGLAATATPAQAQTRGATALQGAWEIEGNPQNAPPGIGPFRSFAVFSAGGTAVEHNGAPGAGAGIGAWEFAGGGEFVVTWVKPLWNPQTGAQAGLLIIKTRIRMKSADQMEAHSKVELRGPDASPLASWTDSGTGKRIRAEHDN
jgi:hypothetical protein